MRSSPLDIYITCELIRRHEQTFAAEQLIRLNLEFSADRSAAEQCVSFHDRSAHHDQGSIG